MIRFLVNRLIWMVITLWVVYTVSFFLMRMVPGGPFDKDRQVPPNVQEKYDEKYNLNDPLIVQYGIHFGRAITGDLGMCYKMPDYTVNEVVAQGFPISASLGVLAMTFALCLGLTTGIVSAVRRQTAMDFALRTLATVGIALPNFIVAIIAVICFSVLLALLPPAGWGSISSQG